MAIAMEKQKQVKKYLEKVVKKKTDELEKSVQRKTESEVESRFDKKKKEIEKALLPLMDAFNKSLEILKAEAKKRDYRIKWKTDYNDEERILPLNVEIDAKKVRDILTEEFKKQLENDIQAKKGEIEQREMEITEKILFAEDEEIAQLVRDFKSMKVEI